MLKGLRPARSSALGAGGRAFISPRPDQRKQALYLQCRVSARLAHLGGGREDLRRRHAGFVSGGRASGERCGSGGDRVTALPVFYLDGGNFQTHLFAQRAANESAKRMRLPTGGLHELLARCAIRVSEHGEHISGFAPRRATKAAACGFRSGLPADPTRTFHQGFRCRICRRRFVYYLGDAARRRSGGRPIIKPPGRLDRGDGAGSRRPTGHKQSKRL
jgi:hypothetical protein